MRPAQIYPALQRYARDHSRATNEIVTLYALERFLVRMTQTPLRNSLLLKGGVLLAAYDLRRPTRDIDLQAIKVTLDEAKCHHVVAAVAGSNKPDGVVLDDVPTRTEPIRNDDPHSGMRVSVGARVYTSRLVIKLDISTGDPIPGALTAKIGPGPAHAGRRRRPRTHRPAGESPARNPHQDSA